MRSSGWILALSSSAMAEGAFLNRLANWKQGRARSASSWSGLSRAISPLNPMAASSAATLALMCSSK